MNSEIKMKKCVQGWQTYMYNVYFQFQLKNETGIWEILTYCLIDARFGIINNTSKLVDNILGFTSLGTLLVIEYTNVNYTITSSTTNEQASATYK